MTSFKNRNCDVLIVGGGPAGLTLANCLALTPLRFIVVEMESPGRRPSRATGLQPRLLELLKHLGIKDELVKQATTLFGNKVFVDGNLTTTVSFYDPHSRSYALSLDQGVIEGMLVAALQKKGASVEWGKRLLNLQKQHGRWIADIEIGGSALEHITADVVVACDGGKSTVRGLAGIDFPGETYHETAFICDCRVDCDLPPRYVHFFFSKEYRLVLVPYSETRYKVSGGMRMQPTTEGHRLITEMANALYPGKLVFEDIADFRFYRMHARIAEVFCRENIFLCGDAAHLFPPNGGQGLNVAIEDAFFLGQLIEKCDMTKRWENLKVYGSRKTQIEEKLYQVKMTKSRYSYESLTKTPIDKEQETKRVIDEEL